jgi:hypothetical protein
MATGKVKAAKRSKKGPSWAQKKRQINNALRRVATAAAALKAAQKALADVVRTDPGGGPDVKN